MPDRGLLYAFGAITFSLIIAAMVAETPMPWWAGVVAGWLCMVIFAANDPT